MRSDFGNYVPCSNYLASFKQLYRPQVESGTSYEILANTYKPYPCGIIVHPSIYGCLDLVCEHDIAPDANKRIELTVDPLAIALCGSRPESPFAKGVIGLN